jgi:small subunit ribosomal protein S21
MEFYGGCRSTASPLLELYPREGREETLQALEVKVYDDLEKAMRALKKKMAIEGVFKEIKKRRFYEKPSMKKKRKTAEAERRRLKALRKMKYGR